MVSICAIERGFVSWCTTVPPVSKLKAMGNWQIWNWVSGTCANNFQMKLFMVHIYDISFLREVGFIKIRALFEQNVRNFHSHGFIIAKCIFSLNWIITNLTPSLYSANRDHNKITILRDENHYDNLKFLELWEEQQKATTKATLFLEHGPRLGKLLMNILFPVSLLQFPPFFSKLGPTRQQRLLRFSPQGNTKIPPPLDYDA